MDWDLMVDLETAAVGRPDALILSAAVRAFRIDDDGVVKLGMHRLWVPDLRAQLAAGRAIDAKTIKWWQQQDSGARLHWTNPVNSAVCEFHVMLQELSTLCLEMGVTGGNRSIWANGITFDISILEHAFEANGMPAPWPYNGMRDMRTVVREFPEVRRYVDDEFMNSHGIQLHEPLSDCEVQIYKLAEHWPRRGNG